MTTSSLRRSVKNIVNNYTEAEIKVREATSNDPWGPPSTLMMEIADLTFNVVAFTEVMGMIWKRLNDHGKNWRHVYKALMLLDYLIKAGSERVAQHCKENVYAIQTLRDFQYIDRDGQDQGVNVRDKAKQLVALLRDDDRLKQERSHAHKTRERMTGAGSAIGYSSLPPPYPGRNTSQPNTATDEYGRPRGSPSPYNSTSSSPHLAPDLEQARPQTSGEEELQLQLALAMSREESEKPPPPADIDEQTQLQIAMSLSKEEAQKKKAPPPAATADMDEETQLQIALSLSKEEHQRVGPQGAWGGYGQHEQQSRLGDESLLQKALEESKREMEAKGGGSAMLDLVDIFASVPEAPPSANQWDLPVAGAHSQAPGPLRSDPWDSLEPSSSRGMGSPWMAPAGSSIHSQPWNQGQRPPDPWETPQNVHSSVPPSQTWFSPASAAARGIDPFSPASADQKSSAGRIKPSYPRPGSPTDGDLFDEAMDGGQVTVNGRSEESPELFDLTRLGEHLTETSQSSRTPEDFLGPSAASLVNLDSLIPSNPSPKSLNPFLSGLNAPSATNPFQNEQPRLTLNQMRPSSVSPAPASLPYSASLPLPASNQPSSLPSSFTEPAQGPMDMPGNLPQPLLPFSSASTRAQPDLSQNPFL
ncbi:epsin-3 isoform X1 [Electrophorus electricus]|uniref:epsin-3 isoform X1 n=1 Tax=Electrophorus electricus TaxID=8005 RepID=UPI0015CFAAA7|nr:epsin-3 isoform X1 [Electrophorus electricus]